MPLERPRSAASSTLPATQFRRAVHLEAVWARSRPRSRRLGRRASPSGAYHALPPNEAEQAVEMGAQAAAGGAGSRRQYDGRDSLRAAPPHSGAAAAATTATRRKAGLGASVVHFTGCMSSMIHLVLAWLDPFCSAKSDAVLTTTPENAGWLKDTGSKNARCLSRRPQAAGREQSAGSRGRESRCTGGGMLKRGVSWPVSWRRHHLAVGFGGRRRDVLPCWPQQLSSCARGQQRRRWSMRWQ